MGREIKDFTELGEYNEFKFRGTVYAVPPFTKKQMGELIDIHAKMSPEDMEEDDTFNADRVKKSFDWQDEYILRGIVKKVDDNYVSLDKNDIENWPIKLKHAIVGEIQREMSFVAEEEEEKN
jgi:hypothetical protein